MKGKSTFTQSQAAFIHQTLKQVRAADRDLQKKLRSELRSMGFYITDFSSSSRGFTADGFNGLIDRGTIKIV